MICLRHADCKQFTALARACWLRSPVVNTRPRPTRLWDAGSKSSSKTKSIRGSSSASRVMGLRLCSTSSSRLSRSQDGAYMDGCFSSLGVMARAGRSSSRITRLGFQF